jgi:hypothetical protein
MNSQMYIDAAAELDAVPEDNVTTRKWVLITPEEAAKRIGAGETVKHAGTPLRRDLSGPGTSILFETDLTKVWIPSERFRQMSDVWMCDDGEWEGEDRPPKLMIFGKLIEPCANQYNGWSATVGHLNIEIPGEGRSGASVGCGDWDSQTTLGMLYKNASPEESRDWCEAKVRELLETAVTEASGKVAWGP